MTCNHDKNSMKALRTTIACRVLGGKFKKGLAIVTRTL